MDGRPLKRSGRRLYLLLNKPPGYVSTVSDPQHRPTVISLVRDIKERVYPVGRLDYPFLRADAAHERRGDGQFPDVPEIRRAQDVSRQVGRSAGRQTLKKLEEGIVLDGRRTAPCQIRPLASREKPWYEITLVEGRYHQVRRMFERIGQAVVKLKRVRIAFLTDHGLAPGRFRQLTPAEVNG